MKQLENSLRYGKILSLKYKKWNCLILKYIKIKNFEFNIKKSSLKYKN